MKNKLTEVVIHIIFWGSTTWLITSGFSIQSHDIEIINGVESVIIVRDNGLIYQLLLCIFISFSAFYLNTWLILKLNRTRIKKSPIWYSGLTFIVVLIVVYMFSELRFFRNEAPIPSHISFGIVIFYFAISIAYSLTKILINNNQREQKWILEKKQAELTLLRNQLQPHFLFNSINNLLSLVNRSQNPKLANSFERLSQLLRYVIEESNADHVVIAGEIKFLKNYIDLQLLRFDEGEVDVQFNVIGHHDNQKIEPGLFITFVENAFKYGTEPETAATIEIEFDLSAQNSIQFRIKNKILMNSKDGIGTGIEATRKRLDLIYPNAHQLIISNSEDFKIMLIIHTQ